MFGGKGPRFREGGSDGVTYMQLLKFFCDMISAFPTVLVSEALNVKSYPVIVISNVHLIESISQQQVSTITVSCIPLYSIIR